LSSNFFRELEIGVPDVFFGIDNSSIGSSIAGTLLASETLFRERKPDAVMILGDTNSAISAIIAERMGIPVYHMEAGNRAFDRNVPEELNRRLIDHVSSFNLVYTEHARRNLASEGLPSKHIFKTGSPLPEVFAHFQDQIQASEILSNLGLEQHGYFLASFHRQENVDNPVTLRNMIAALENLATQWQLPIVVSLHPRTESKIHSLESELHPLIKFHKPFGYFDYSQLQVSAKCVISDSGSIAEEAAAMNFPAVSFRNSIERPEALEQGTVILSSTDSPGLLEAVKSMVEIGGPVSVPQDYFDRDFSQRVLSILLSTARQHRRWFNLTQKA
jgi:UDP-N-acetylglucosamine 2-epimerase (non-hydrolysing)